MPVRKGTGVRSKFGGAVSSSGKGPLPRTAVAKGRSNAGGATRGTARAAQVRSLNKNKKALSVPGKLSAKVAAARRGTAPIGARQATAPRSNSGQLKYGQVRGAGQGMGAALESYGDIGDFLKNLGR